MKRPDLEVLELQARRRRPLLVLPAAPPPPPGDGESRKHDATAVTSPLKCMTQRLMLSVVKLVTASHWHLLQGKLHKGRSGGCGVPTRYSADVVTEH